MNDDPASLDRLHGLAVPEPVSAWPPGPGWWVLLALFGLAAAAAAVRLVRRHRAGAYRRAALAELGEPGTAAEVVALLKRTALSAWPRGQVASLDGERWLAWLGETGGAPVPEPLRPLILESPYTDPGGEAPPALRAFVGAWIRNHRR
jgi:hypothetical protein